jgi:hypothetical protein
MRGVSAYPCGWWSLGSRRVRERERCSARPFLVWKEPAHGRGTGSRAPDTRNLIYDWLQATPRRYSRVVSASKRFSMDSQPEPGFVKNARLESQQKC